MLSLIEQEKLEVTGQGGEFCDGYGYGFGLTFYGIKGYGKGKATGKNVSTNSDLPFQYAGR